MAESETQAKDTKLKPEPFAPKQYFSTLPTWKKALLAGGVALLAVGLVTVFLEDPKPVPEPGSMTSLNAGQESAEPAQATWSEAFFKFGFSFFVGFTVGYACRAFMKFLFFLVGGMAVVLFAMSYYGFISVEWVKMETSFDQLASSVQGQFGEFRTFITGSLPNASLAGIGLFAGFKKNG